MTKTPQTEFKAGQIRATIWKNERKEGQNYDTYSTVVDKSYMDKEGNWKKTTNFQLNDLPKVVLVTQKCYEYLSLNNNEELGETLSSNLCLNKTSTIKLNGEYTQINTPELKVNPSDCIIPTTEQQKAYNKFKHIKFSLDDKKVLGIIDALEYDEQLNTAIKDYASLF